MINLRALLIVLLLPLVCRGGDPPAHVLSDSTALAAPGPSALSEARQRALRSKIDPYLDHGGVAVVGDDGQVLYEQNGRQRFMPASTLKIATASAAIHHLGLEYRHRTELYLSDQRDLTIRGYGDPFLISEEWELIVQELIDSAKLPRRLRNIYIDTSAFAAEIDIPGVDSSLNPYDARNGALAVNFNTVNVAVERGGGLRSAESQTPLTPLARELAARLPPGKHRINLSRDPAMPPRYAGELARAFLEARGFEITGSVAVRERTAEDELILTHRNTRTVGEVVAAMMRYSNNFIANQLLLTIGLEEDGEPATLEQGVSALRRFLINEVGLGAADFTVVEGSGISRQNRFTPRALAAVVRAFYPHRHLLTREDGIALKTGTLSGAYALAGYLSADRPLCFVILLNQPRNTRDQILAVLNREIGRAFEPSG